MCPRKISMSFEISVIVNCNYLLYKSDALLIFKLDFLFYKNIKVCKVSSLKQKKIYGSIHGDEENDCRKKAMIGASWVP